MILDVDNYIYFLVFWKTVLRVLVARQSIKIIKPYAAIAKL